MMTELWKDVVGYEDILMVSSLGNVWSKRSKKILKPSWNPNGRKYVSTKIGGRNGVHKTLKISRLVAIAFIDNPHNKPQVNHIDGDKTNDSLSNLEWCTQSENMKHAYRTGLKSHAKGTDSRLSALTEEQLKFVRESYKSRDRNYGARALGRKYSVHHTTILKHLGDSHDK